MVEEQHLTSGSLPEQYEQDAMGVCQVVIVTVANAEVREIAPKG